MHGTSNDGKMLSLIFMTTEKAYTKSRGIFRFHRYYHTLLLFSGPCSSPATLSISFSTFVISASSTFGITTFRAVFMDWMDALKSIWKHLSIAVQRKETLDQIKENCFPKKSERRNIFVAFIMKENGKLRKKEQKRTEDLMLYGISYPFMMLANMKTKHKLLGDSKYAHTNTCHVHFYIHTHTLHAHVVRR